MSVRIVQSRQNARLKELRRALSRPGRDARGLAGIEGLHLLEESLRADLRVACVFLAQEANEPLQGLVLPSETEMLAVPRALLNSILQTETPQPVAALVEVPDWTWAHVLRRQSGMSLVVILAGIQDPGNLGTILRSAEAFGASGLVSLPGTVCAWNPKAVRASAGSVFRIPLITASEEECVTDLREAGIRILSTSVAGAQPADLVDLVQPTALLIGNEGSGVPEHLASQADGHITIPCPGPVESLNAAVATSILLYEASRQRQAEAGGPHSHRGRMR